MRKRHSLLGSMVDGVMAGAIATWALDSVTSALYDRESKSVRDREDRVRGGTSAYAIAADKIAALVGRTLDPQERDRFASRIHWALGLSAGAVYGMVRGSLPEGALTNGLLFGILLYLVMDEGAVYALGLTPGPMEFPWQTHARGLAGHLAYGAAANVALRAIQGARDGE